MRVNLLCVGRQCNVFKSEVYITPSHRMDVNGLGLRIGRRVSFMENRQQRDNIEQQAQSAIQQSKYNG